MSVPISTEELLPGLGPDVLAQVALRLECKDLIRLGSCCKQLQADLLSPALCCAWRSHCEEYLGSSLSALLHGQTQLLDPSCACCWRQLCCSSRSMDTMCKVPAFHSKLSLHPGGSRMPHSTAAPAGSCSSDHTAAPGSSSSSSNEMITRLLSRHGHAVTPTQHLLVVTGGITMGASGCSSTTDVLVLNLRTRQVLQPPLLGAPPSHCYHHTATPIQPTADCELAQQMKARLQKLLDGEAQGSWPAASRCSITDGHTLLLFGGCNAEGLEQSADAQLQLLWLCRDGSYGAWLSVEAMGEAPGARSQHAAQAVRGGQQVVVYGGTVGGTMQGTVAHDVCLVKGFLLLSLYVLDVLELRWSRKNTWPLNEPPKPGHVMIGPTTCPGPRRSVLTTTRVSPVTGVEELVVLGGCGTDGLADFVPYALDLTSFTWRKGPIMGYLPPLGEHPALLQMGPDWLLLVRGNASGSTDVERLDLRTLRWRAPPRLVGLPGPTAAAGTTGVPAAAGGTTGFQGAALLAPYTAGAGVGDTCVWGGAGAAGLLLGGITQSLLGPAPAARCDLLLPGRPCSHACLGSQAGTQAAGPVRGAVLYQPRGAAQAAEGGAWQASNQQARAQAPPLLVTREVLLPQLHSQQATASSIQKGASAHHPAAAAAAGAGAAWGLGSDVSDAPSRWSRRTDQQQAFAADDGVMGVNGAPHRATACPIPAVTPAPAMQLEQRTCSCGSCCGCTARKAAHSKHQEVGDKPAAAAAGPCAHLQAGRLTAASSSAAAATAGTLPRGNSSSTPVMQQGALGSARAWPSAARAAGLGAKVVLGSSGMGAGLVQVLLALLVGVLAAVVLVPDVLFAAPAPPV